MKIILILLFSVLNGQGFLDYLSGPITLKVGLVSGYDDNVLRFSDIEKRQASENKLIMDGTDTFDSHFSRLYLVGEKKIQLIVVVNIFIFIHEQIFRIIQTIKIVNIGAEILKHHINGVRIGRHHTQ